MKWQNQDLDLKPPGPTSVLNHNSFTTLVAVDLKFFLLFTTDALKCEGYILSDKAKSLNSK